MNNGADYRTEASDAAGESGETRGEVQEEAKQSLFTPVPVCSWKVSVVNIDIFVQTLI
jgi:hypothetical protein